MAINGNSNGIDTFTIVASLAAVTAATGSEKTLTIPGLVFGRDHILRFHKKTNQDGLVISDFYCSADNTAKIRLQNVTVSDITPTVSDTYTVTVLRTEAQVHSNGAVHL